MLPNLVLLLLVSISVEHAVGSSQTEVVLVDVALNEGALSGPLPSDFTSFSVEVHCAMVMLMNETDNTPRPSYLNMMGFLRKASRGTRGPNLRVGGDSTDESVFRWNESDPVPFPSTYRVTPRDVKAFGYVAGFNGTLTLGLNLGYDLPKESVNYAAAVIELLKPLPLLQAFEIGNEPDLYAKYGKRSSSYNYAAYQKDYEAWMAALKHGGHKTLPHLPIIQGAVFCCVAFDAGLPGYIRTFVHDGELSSVSYHHYPLTACHGHKVNIHELVTAEAAESVDRLSSFASTAVAVGRPFYIGEGNSVACGGAYGVSDTFASTLWSIDTLFHAAKHNMTRWNFHGCPQGAYTPIALEGKVSPVDQRYSVARPLYYGMWLVSDAIARNAHVVPTHQSSPWDVNETIASFATHTEQWLPEPGGPNCTSRSTIVVLNRQWRTHTKVRVKATVRGLSGSHLGTAYGRRLAPASHQLGATHGIYFAGLTFDNTTDGLPHGQYAPFSVSVSKEGALEFDLDSISIVTISLYDHCNH